jgi:hypothetical protein
MKMSVLEKCKHIAIELKGHAPFTLLGALLGIVFMVAFSKIGETGSHTLFAIFHPGHVLLSAMVTASMFSLHKAKKKVWLILIVGYVGSVGIATISDIVIPHIGTRLLGLDMPTHAQIHHSHKEEHEDEHEQHEDKHLEHEGHEHEHQEHKHKSAIHLGFIEEWYIVNPAALLGIAIAYFLPRTKFPHGLHVLISTWASSSYLLMSVQGSVTMAAALGIFATLFLAVWVPCCISDIIFPLLFVKPDVKIKGSCPFHAHHSHEHSESEDNHEDR